MEKREVSYFGNKIIAWKKDKNIFCHLYKKDSKWQPLNLGECNDGGKFTAVNQAVNQAKKFIDTCKKYNW